MQQSHKPQLVQAFERPISEAVLSHGVLDMGWIYIQVILIHLRWLIYVRWVNYPILVHEVFALIISWYLHVIKHYLYRSNVCSEHYSMWKELVSNLSLSASRSCLEDVLTANQLKKFYAIIGLRQTICPERWIICLVFHQMPNSVIAQCDQLTSCIILFMFCSHHRLHRWNRKSLH